MSPAQYSAPGGGSQGYRPPGGGYGGGGPVSPVGAGADQILVDPSDEQGRVSPVIEKDERGNTYHEWMSKQTIPSQSGGGHIKIDIDRHGGVFLDHGELAKLLDGGDINTVITQVRQAILTAKSSYGAQGSHRVGR